MNTPGAGRDQWCSASLRATNRSLAPSAAICLRLKAPYCLPASTSIRRSIAVYLMTGSLSGRVGSQSTVEQLGVTVGLKGASRTVPSHWHPSVVEGVRTLGVVVKPPRSADDVRQSFIDFFV